MKFIKTNKYILFGSFIGATLGYLYYYFVGCPTGSCAITSNPIKSSLYGSIMFGLLISMIKTSNKEKNGTQ